MNPIIKYFSLLILLTLVLGCNSVNSEEKSEKSPEELIIGTWQLRDVDNGVTYRADFKDLNRVTQYFEDYTGYGKMYPGEWELLGDTLHISERQGQYKLLLLELSDSLMLLLRPDSSAMLFDRVLPEEP